MSDEFSSVVLGTILCKDDGECCMVVDVLDGERRSVVSLPYVNGRYAWTLSGGYLAPNGPWKIEAP